MTSILVSGLINVETTLRVEGFPLPYAPVRYPFFGVGSSVAGVGYNVTKALTTLGQSVRFLSLVGRDLAGQTARATLAAEGLPGDDVLATLAQTPQSVILYDGEGRRAIHTDLKDIQSQAYPLDRFEAALAPCELAALCNVNFSRPFLQRAKAAGKLVATDVHAIADLDDPYNRDFMAAADVLFQSHERLPAPPDEWIRGLWARYETPIAVVGLGEQGALLGVRADGAIERVPAVRVRPIVSTIGAGDALFAAFLDGFLRTRDPYAALRRATCFAAWKIGEASAAAGFLPADELDALVARVASARR